MSQNAPEISNQLETAEPVAGRSGVPIWLIVLLGLLLFWGLIYVDGHGGWFNPEVFEPFTSYHGSCAMPAATIRKATIWALGRVHVQQIVRPRAIKPTALGKEGQFPPLAGSDWLMAPGRTGLAALC